MSRQPSSRAEATPGQLDDALQGLSLRAGDWVTIRARERARFLRACLAGVVREADDWVRGVCRIQGIDPLSGLAGEAWLAGPTVVVRNLRLLAESLEHGGRLRPPAIREGPGNRWIADVMPTRNLDAIVYRGIEAQVWGLPGSEPDQGRIYREPGGRGGIALVLGAGNVSSIGPLDVIHRLFVDNEVVILKMHPVLEDLAPVLERAFAVLVEAGYLRIVTGGVETGRYLCEHEAVDSIHLTGSDRTHDAIVWGPDPEEGERRKRQGRPVNHRRITAELGCVTPVLVVPGEWSEAEIRYQALHVAGMVTNNASFNCNAAKVVLTARGWPQRDAFLEALRRALARIPPRRAYYPGAEERHAAFCERYPEAETLGSGASPGTLPWTLVPGVPPAEGELALNREAFCGVVAEVPLDAASPVAFLERAVPVCNERIWGNLSCMLLVDPRTEDATRPDLEAAVTRLRYGGIGINVWSGLLFGLGSTTWGAYPGNPPEDIQSGVGTVHNAFLFDHPERSVVRAPFRSWPRPPWLGGHRNLRGLGRALLDLEAAPAWVRLPRVFLEAIRG